MIGITGYSAYIPRLRLERATISSAWETAGAAGEIAVANYDEDALTMAVEATLSLLGEDGSSSVDGLYFASTSAPYREKQVASVVATACDLPRWLQTIDFTGSTRAGLSALIAAGQAVKSGSCSDVVVVAADARLAQPESEIEGLLGEGGAAVRVGSTNVLAEIVGAAFVSEEFTHFWRTDGDRFVQGFPGRFSNSFGYEKHLGDAVRALLEAQHLEPGAIAKAAFAAPDSRAAADLAKQIGLDPKRQLVSPPNAVIGSAGTADALLVIGAALDSAAPGDLVLVGAYGEGADALLLRVTDRIRERRTQKSFADWVAAKQKLSSYAKYLKYRRVIELDEAGEAINNVLERKELKQDVRLYGSRCDACGTVQYPLAKVCIKCKARERMSDVRLSRRGVIFTFTIDHLISNLEHPLPMAVVDLDGGGRLYLQVTDFVEEEVDIGRPVTLTYRRLHEGGGNHNYYWKARPLR